MSRINLYNYRQQEHYYRKLRVFCLFFLTIMLSLGLNLLIYGYYQLKLFQQTQRNNFLTARLEQLDQQIQPVYDYTRKLEFLSSRIALLRTMTAKRNDLLAFLQQINTITPPQIYYSQINWQINQVELLGVTTSPLYLADFLTKLRSNDSIFFNPVLKSNDSSDGIKHNFRLRLAIKPNLVADHDPQN